MKRLTKEEIDTLLNDWHQRMLERDSQLRREIESGLCNWTLRAYAEHCEGTVDVLQGVLERTTVDSPDDEEGYQRPTNSRIDRARAYRDAREIFESTGEDEADWLPIFEDLPPLDELDDLSQRELLRGFLWAAMDTYRTKASRCYEHQRPLVTKSQPAPIPGGTQAPNVTPKHFSAAWHEYCADNARTQAAWQGGKVPDSAQQAYADALALWGDVAVRDINREMCLRLRDFEEKQPRRDVEQYHGWSAEQILGAEIPEEHRRRGKAPQEFYGRIKSFLSWAEDNNYISKNPGLRVRVATIKGDGSLPWTDTELQQLFCLHALQKHSGLENPRTKCRSLPLVMLLLLYTGARLNEICYLRCQDFTEKDEHSKGEIPAFVIDNHDGRTVKTDSSRRKIPLHPHLEQVGVLDYFRGRKSAGECYLLEIPEKGKQLGKGRGKAVTQIFGRYAKRLGFPRDGTKSLRSFRSTLATRGQTKFDSGHIRLLLGHAKGDVHDKHYTKRMQMDLDDLYTSLERVTFGLDLGELRQILAAYVPDYG